ncbi:MAG: tetratricopeptide repeat protein [Bryobacteraceae bacterium]
MWSARVLLKVLPFTLSFLASIVLFAQEPAGESALEAAASDFAQGRIAEADSRVDAILKDHPADLRALILKGAVLDSQQRYNDAESYYHRALKLAPNSAQVFNNVANHYLASGDTGRARKFYLMTVAIDPHHANANLQLAQISVDEKQGRQALAFLSRLPNSATTDPATVLLHARALALSGQCSDAASLLRSMEAQASGGPSVYFSAGTSYAQCKLYEEAEQSFSRVLDAEPTNFDVLYNLGLAAFEAGHSERARAVLETALKDRPEDPDCLYTLAQVYLKQERPVDAAALLAKAQKLAPGRADVVLLLAQITARLEFFKDAAAQYDEYLKLKPGDDVARRERGFTLACANQFKSARSDLEWYVHKHPYDPVGFYELAVAKAFEDRTGALQDLDRALTLDPGLGQARYARALLNIEEEKPAAAVEDLQVFVKQEPNDYRALAHLGQAYLALDRVSDAADVLKRSVDLAPDARLALVHYRRALVKLGRTEEARAILSRLKEPATIDEGRRPQAGLIDYLSLSPADRRTRYLANLRRNVTTNPSDVQWKVRLGRELLAEGNTDEGLKVFREIKSSSSDRTLLAACGRILLDFEQYDLALEFLKGAVAADPPPSGARLDLAIVLFHLQTPQVALSELDQTPVADRKGDYYLLRAQILDSLGKMQEAVEALNRGIRAAPTRPGLYLQAAGFLLKHKLYHEASDLLDQASRILPDERELLLAQAVTLELLQRGIDAQRLLKKLQARWPEWDRPYLLNGILLEIQLKSAEARQMLETAIALGANTPEVYYYQALAITHAAPNALDSAQHAIARALTLSSKDPYIFLLAGKISLAKKDYDKAIRYLLDATRLQPTLIPAHYALRDAYKALGDEQKSAAEMGEIKRIARGNPTDDQNPFSMQNFLFAVRPPG